MDRHSELELKYSAEHVDVDRFRLWCIGLDPAGYKSTAYPDIYYRNGEAVVRHRRLPGPGEITVKQRKSSASIVDRLEVNLGFAEGTTYADVTAFLHATGWVAEFTLQKRFSHVFVFKHGNAEICVSLYEVKREDTRETRRFLEVEIERSSDISEETARKLLGLWGGSAAHEFRLDEPLNDSLYEIYSGRRYASVA